MSNIASMQQPVSRSYSQNAVIGIASTLTEEFKSLRFNISKLVNTAYDVAYNTSDHTYLILCYIVHQNAH